VIANAQIDPRVPNGALGFVGAMQDLPAHTSGGSTLMVFAVPGPLRTAGDHENHPQTTGQGQPAQPTQQEELPQKATPSQSQPNEP
jgi:alcohol dehydrogenase (cytochrome c)